MNKTKIYLDWNVFTNMINFQNLPSEEDKETYGALLLFLIKAAKHVVLPYSDAHLDDLMKSYKQGEREKVDAALNVLSVLTNDICLCDYWGKKTAIWQDRDPREFFASMIEDDLSNSTLLETMKKTVEESGMMSTMKSVPHNMDFTQWDPSNPLYNLFFKKSRIQNTQWALFEDIFDLFDVIRTSPSVYNELRQIIRSGLAIGNKVHQSEDPIKALDEMLPKSILNKSFQELSEISTIQNVSQNQDSAKITTRFMNLDMLGYGYDKLTDKNQYNNLFNDARHCYYGSLADFFLTADKKTFKKATAVYNDLGIKTKVMKPKEFVDWIQKLASESEL